MAGCRLDSELADLKIYTRPWKFQLHIFRRLSEKRVNTVRNYVQDFVIFVFFHFGAVCVCESLQHTLVERERNTISNWNEVQMVCGPASSYNKPLFSTAWYEKKCWLIECLSRSVWKQIMIELQCVYNLHVLVSITIKIVLLKKKFNFMQSGDQEKI